MLPKKQKIGPYVVTFPIKEGSYAETYRIKDSLGKNYFLKLINYAKLSHTQFDEDGNVLELEIAKQLHHANICAYHDSGETFIEGTRYVYLVYDFISGETAAQKTIREQRCTVYDAKQIVIGVLNGLKFLHNLPRPIIHNELTTQNVMLDISSGAPMAKIIDFGHARYQDQPVSSFKREGLNPFYLAPEALNGIFSPQSDIFSVGVMLYQLLFGMLPYFTDLSGYPKAKDSQIEAIESARTKGLRIPDTNKFELDEQLINTMSKALAIDIKDRFLCTEDFIKALNGEIHVEPIATKTASPTFSSNSQTDSANKTPKLGNGFKDVAGMDKLKDQLRSDVIELLQNPEQAKSLGLSIPNGLLFYGPPGCGKTFFAEKFAEEAGFNYKYIKCSDVASPFIHGGQEKIAAIFEDARHNAPTILFFDEIDAMLTDRKMQTNVSESGEVNEFLAQLNNCGKDGVLVIGATNKPDKIDEAALRSGRLEYKYYIAQPDTATRAKIFEIELKKRKCDFGIDYEHLASMTENYISADITHIIDEAARMTFRNKAEKITQLIIEEAIRETKPSISLEMIRAHEAIRDRFNGNTEEQPQRRIGFKQ